jgi:sugar transferase (PEP-CTERM/EpsH1 system associated)
MAKILFLAHRVPFPPNKGDKIRAYNILEHLSAQHDIWLGATADDPADMAHLSWARQHYRDAYFGAPGRLTMAANMALAALTGRPASVGRFRNSGLGRWIGKVLDEVRPDIVYVFSSALAHYVAGRIPAGSSLIVDFVDADAEKWRTYAARAHPPLRWIYGAEFRNLVRYEARVLEAADASILITKTERDLMAQFQPDAAAKLHVVGNGVDTDYFAPPAGTVPGSEIVFCGLMDYLPNIDAACWFARDVFPSIRRSCPQALLRVVGARPAAAVQALARLDGVHVTGAVPDVRPYLHGAAAVVAPLRIARGIQNKVLEGMAAGRPMIVTSQALDGIGASHGHEVLVADTSEDMARAVIAVLRGEVPTDLGAAGRAYVVAHHRWDKQLAGLNNLIADASHDAHARLQLRAGETMLATGSGSRRQARMKNA